MPTFVFVRHAQGYHNVDGNKRGNIAYSDPKHIDASLTELGILQSKIKNLPYEKFDAIYCSPMKRCRQTLLNIYQQSEKLPVVVDDRLIEQPQGLYLCNKRVEKHEMLLSIPMAWNTDNVSDKNPFILNPELDRYKIKSFTKMICEKYPSGIILIVSHGVWIQNWLKMYNNNNKFLDNCESIIVTL